MPEQRIAALCRAISETACPLRGSPADYDQFLEWIGDARFVLLGEATHGTHEFYRERALITKRLIERKGFRAVAAEADWPDAWSINEFVRGRGDSSTAAQSLEGFRRFPNWMWRNAEVVEFVEWLRAYNDGQEAHARAGFYGLDLYSLHRSMRAVLQYLSKIDPDAARRARYRYSCFDHFGEDVQAYGYAAGFGLSESCQQEAVAQLVEMQRRAAELAQRDGIAPEESYFTGVQNARVVRNAEEYYRSMFGSRASTWNLRDRHMAETLDVLVQHLEKRHGEAKIAVWAHNSHLGDARATEMAEAGELNLGQLVRERYGEATVLTGFTTYDGTVIAADDWDGAAELKKVRPALRGSFEELFHQADLQQFLLLLRGENRICAELAERRLERAIGVIYRPLTERASHYFHAELPRQFDAVLHFDRTRGVEPLERIPDSTSSPEYETSPFGV